MALRADGRQQLARVREELGTRHARFHGLLADDLWTLMVENYRSGLVWRLMRSYSPIARGLRRAGFTGGWL